MRTLIPYVVSVFVIGFMLWQQQTPETVLMPDPELVFPEIEGMQWTDQEMSDSERRTLPADTRLLRRVYTDAAGRFYQVTAVIGGRSKSSVHRPELCLPGQGFMMNDPRTIRVHGVSWRRLTLRKGGEAEAGFAYTFANGSGFRTSSHLVRIFTDVWNRSIRGRIDRWIMLTVFSSVADDRGLSAFLEKIGGVLE